MEMSKGMDNEKTCWQEIRSKDRKHDVALNRSR